MKNKGLYIHIPFCSHLCSYCDFTKMFYNESICDQYLDELNKELMSYDVKDINSIYVGGGTPSSLNFKQLSKLLEIIKPYANENISYAFEANIENLTKEKIEILAKNGVNRISLGVQTFNEALLKDMNRHHNKDDVNKVIGWIKECGIDDINIDLIYGLPNQSLKDVKSDLEIAMTLPITHISTYSLIVNEHTKFYLDGVKEKEQDEVRIMYDNIVAYLKEHEIYRYEVSNFAKKGYESKHNNIYWHNEEYYGIGLGASGYIDGIRYTNTKSINKYLKGIYRYEEESVSNSDKDFYKVMLGLRLEEGVEIPSIYQDKVETLINRGLLERQGKKVKVTEDNLFIMDYILKELLF